MPAGDKLQLDDGSLEFEAGTVFELHNSPSVVLEYHTTPDELYLVDDGAGPPPTVTDVLLLEAAAPAAGSKLGYRPLLTMGMGA